jgi:hypothetical protein
MFRAKSLPDVQWKNPWCSPPLPLFAPVKKIIEQTTERTTPFPDNRSPQSQIAPHARWLGNGRWPFPQARSPLSRMNLGKFLFLLVIIILIVILLEQFVYECRVLVSYFLLIAAYRMRTEIIIKPTIKVLICTVENNPEFNGCRARKRFSKSLHLHCLYIPKSLPKGDTRHQTQKSDPSKQMGHPEALLENDFPPA